MTVWRAESGRTFPNATTLAALALALDCEAIELVSAPPQADR